MIFNLSEEDKKRFYKLVDILNDNDSIASFYLDYLTFDKNCITSKLMENKADINDAFYKNLMYLNEIDPSNHESIYFYNEYFSKGIKCLNPLDYQNNEYYKCVKPKEVAYKNRNLFYDYYQPYEGFVYKDLTLTEDYKEIPNIGFFTQIFKFLEVAQGDTVWMSITPNEIETMKEAIQNAHGNVLVFGLGLGYFPFMIALKNEVSKITIIEKSKEIIEIFNKFIFPFFKNKEKIKIVNDDAFQYLKIQKNVEKVDYIFADIWHDQGDGLELMMKFKPFEKEYSFIEFDYWLEESILASIRRNLIILIDEEIKNNSDKNYLKAKNYTDKLINSLHFYLKMTKINSFKDINDLLTKDSLKRIALNLEIK